MKKIKLDIDDLITVLDAMKENGTTSVIFFEYEDAPAMADADEPENIILFQADGEVENDPNEAIH